MKLSVSILELLAGQYRHEVSNALRYTARASLCEFRGLTGSAKLFSAQAAGERDHAETVYKIIQDRNALLEPSPFTLDESVNGLEFKALFETSLAIEEETTGTLNAIAQCALAEGDFETFGQIQPMIAEQIEETNLFQTILDRISVTFDPGTPTGEQIHLLDVWIGTL